jgi:hypothetical protein
MPVLSSITPPRSVGEKCLFLLFEYLDAAAIVPHLATSAGLLATGTKRGARTRSAVASLRQVSAVCLVAGAAPARTRREIGLPPRTVGGRSLCGACGAAHAVRLVAARGGALTPASARDGNGR